MSPRVAARVALIAAVLVTAACGQEPATPPSSTPSPAGPTPRPGLVADDDQGPFEVSGLVLQDETHGPRLCVGNMTASFPPQCGGRDLLGWDFASVPADSYETTGQVLFGDFTVTVSFEGAALRVTGPARPGRLPVPDAVPAHSGSPCPDPPGGWRAVDPARSNGDALQAVMVRAAEVPGYGELWIDQRVPEFDLTGEFTDDPLPFVLDVSTAGDVAVMESAVREVWGGALCVSSVPRSDAELTAVETRLLAPGVVPDLVTIERDVPAGQVAVTVLVARESDQHRLDEDFGVGAVRLRSVMRSTTEGSWPLLDSQ